MTKKLFVSLAAFAVAIVNGSSVENLCNQYYKEKQNNSEIDSLSDGNRTGGNKSSPTGKSINSYVITDEGKLISVPESFIADEFNSEK